MHHLERVKLKQCLTNKTDHSKSKENKTKQSKAAEYYLVSEESWFEEIFRFLDLYLFIYLFIYLPYIAFTSFTL